MPYVVNTGYYPPDKVDEVIKAFFEMMKKYPHDDSLATLAVPISTIRTENGWKGMTVFNVNKGKLEELLAIIEKRMAVLRNIPGFNSKAEVWMTLEEGLEAVGQTIPT